VIPVKRTKKLVLDLPIDSDKLPGRIVSNMGNNEKMIVGISKFPGEVTTAIDTQAD